MCGFAGFLDLQTNPPPQTQRQQILSAMGQALSRRGPDDEQFFDEDLSFVFRRLSIVDLQTGQQPIWNEDHSLFIAINGEIYNHKDLRSYLTKEHHFRTRSDAEVVLHLYEERGPKALDLLIGMFSIVIWDVRQKRLFLARDRLGVKPLFFYRSSSFLLFGSELKALLCHPQCPRDLRWSQIEPYFQPSVAHGLASYVNGVEQLPAGHFATYQEGRWSLHSYWSLEDHFIEDTSKSPEKYVEEYADLLEDSVQKRLMSDVPVGSFFSGGLDSAIIVALASRTQGELHCFHALEKAVSRCGDTKAAQTLASLLRLPFHPIVFDHQSLVEELHFDLASFEYFIWLFDAPRFHLEWLLKHEMHRYAKTLDPSMKVILLGQGADEFTGGYSRIYSMEGSHPRWEDFLQNLNNNSHQEITKERQIAPALRELLREEYVLSLTRTKRGAFQEEMHRRIDVLQNFNLWHEDRSSAGQGMESRVPFLDHRLLELLASVPEPLHKELFWNKTILRRAAQRWLPKELIERPKVGFFFTRDRSSIYDLSLRLLTAVYPAFEEKYLRQPDALFTQEKLRNLFERALKGGYGAQLAVEKLFASMATEVFNTLCKRPVTQMPGFTIPSPLQEANAALIDQWSSLQDEEIPDLTPTEEVSLDVEIKVLRSLEDPPILYFLREDTLAQEVELGEGMEWIEPLVIQLQKGKHTLPELTALLQIPEDDLQQALRYLLGLEIAQRTLT